VEPIQIVPNYARISDFDESDPYIYIECIQTIYPIKGHSTPVSPGTTIEYEVPDMFGRPWAQLWEKIFRGGHAAAGRRRYLRLRRLNQLI